MMSANESSLGDMVVDETWSELPSSGLKLVRFVNVAFFVVCRRFHQSSLYTLIDLFYNILI
jgi:hypothetical protein